jgi:hypothetical protein
VPYPLIQSLLGPMLGVGMPITERVCVVWQSETKSETMIEP